MSFRLEYEVGEAGWANCCVAFDEQLVKMTVSYLHDSLHELCDVVASIAGGAQTGTVVFMDEPGEHHMNLTRVTDNDVLVHIVWHDDWTSWGIASANRVVLQGTTSISHLRDQTYSAVRDILDCIGPTEYRRRWGEHDFPEAAFRRLEETLLD
ncbi:MAG: hypothetical protein ACOY0T_21355 [Myxococcota bacterium]